ncbi:MAG: ABC transporter substrate-binding protein [SAR324 cluster bacterium]|nr:ABC transporter substrate-binding protein [SAR324 cluster bacterium]MBL7035126.1 ABC transporter substrate-binding protein [SAR324 cluster bacterium]
MKKIVATLMLITLIGLVFSTAQAKTFRWAFQGDAQSLDPHSLNETFTLGLLGNVYEGLVRRDADLKIIPALAAEWQVVEPTRWRFKLRQGVTFHNGNKFNADDVLFSYGRAKMEGSDLTKCMATVKEVLKVDEYTVDFVTTTANPILTAEWSSCYIMDKEWSESNGAGSPTSVTEGKENHATRHANGTGPFVVVSRETDVKTVLKPNKHWWDTAQHNLTEVIFTPIGSDATRVAALLSGEIDMMYPVPVQDIQRVNSNEGTSAMLGPELRTIFLGMDQARDELLYSNVKGKNPFKDVRVREAFMLGINIEAIKKKVMRNLSAPAALMISPSLFTHSGQFSRPAYNPDRAKELLADAGYPEGFEVGMDCPNNRYVNDEKICQAVVAMLAKVGVKVNLLAQPKAQYFAKVLRPKWDTSFYLLGWTPGSFDSWNVLYNILGGPSEDGRGKFNLTGYSNARVDELTDKILVTTDAAKRDEMIREAYQITVDEHAYLPLHQQGLAWSKKDSVSLKQRADNQFMIYHVNLN